MLQSKNNSSMSIQFLLYISQVYIKYSQSLRFMETYKVIDADSFNFYKTSNLTSTILSLLA